MKKNQDEGFTLIELLIVIVILGILAAVVVFAVGGISDTGEANACKTEKRTVETAVEAFRAQKGTYPNNMSSMLSTNAAAGQAKLLRSAPKYWSIGNDNGVVSAVGTLPSGCS